MPDILELDRNLLYVEDENWQCCLKRGRNLLLGVVLEAANLGGGDFPYVVDACLIPQPEGLHPDLIQEAEDEGAVDRDQLISYIYQNYGGVPVNIDALQPAKASCGFSSFVANTAIGSASGSTGSDQEVRRFENLEEAMTFARDFYAPYASLLFRWIDVILNQPLRTGNSGWEKLAYLTED
ncbi:MAG: hypothetical protein HPY61_10995 [Methanotrichaceae archaeon]|nr:hypothetical protein [Methanotrichaceae archaeon]